MCDSVWHASQPPFFFFNDTATTEIYTLSLHDALPICLPRRSCAVARSTVRNGTRPGCWIASRSEEHTSELQSQSNLVCRLLLEKKKYSLRGRLVWTWTTRSTVTYICT